MFCRSFNFSRYSGRVVSIAEIYQISQEFNGGYCTVISIDAACVELILLVVQSFLCCLLALYTIIGYRNNKTHMLFPHDYAVLSQFRFTTIEYQHMWSDSVVLAPIRGCRRHQQVHFWWFTKQLVWFVAKVMQTELEVYNFKTIGASFGQARLGLIIDAALAHLNMAHGMIVEM